MFLNLLVDSNEIFCKDFESLKSFKQNHKRSKRDNVLKYNSHMPEVEKEHQEKLDIKHKLSCKLWKIIRSKEREYKDITYIFNDYNYSYNNCNSKEVESVHAEAEEIESEQADAKEIESEQADAKEIEAEQVESIQGESEQVESEYDDWELDNWNNRGFRYWDYSDYNDRDPDDDVCSECSELTDSSYSVY
jgi:hypothetical protein